MFKKCINNSLIVNNVIIKMIASLNVMKGERVSSSFLYSGSNLGYSTDLEQVLPKR